MANTTKIQWCDSTVNPTMGCDGCELWNKSRHSCYAGILHKHKGGTNHGFSPYFKILTPYPGRMAKAAGWSCLRDLRRNGAAWKDGLPRMIFVSDMSDALSEAVTFEYLLTEVIENVRTTKGQRHIWQWLTKRPARMAEFAAWLKKYGVPWPSNLWAGTSLTTNVTTTVSQQRLKGLLNVSAVVRFLSVEPQIEDIDLDGCLEGIHWVIQGGESGTGARRFDVEWADRMRRQCQQAEVAYFLKQLGANPYEAGKPLKLRDAHGGKWLEWHKHLRVRDFPATKA